MGRIKTTLIKRTGKKLMVDNSDAFTTEFKNNKKAIEGKLEVHSKKLRNVLAGYLTKLKKKKE